jgi:Leucine-rich repeat (LRR) protein
MFSHKYIVYSSNYASNKTNKILKTVVKNKQISTTKIDNILEFENNIFECEKNAILEYYYKFYKINKSVYLGIVESIIDCDRLVISNIDRVGSAIQYLNCTSLKSLIIQDNDKLTNISKSIGKLSKLTHLSIRCNGELTHIPKSIGKLSNLIQLCIEFNDLKHIPESIGKLSNLCVLTLDYNNFAHIPKSIGNLSNLHTLSLCGNTLNHIPNWISKLSKLKLLWIMDNMSLNRDYVKKFIKKHFSPTKTEIRY